MRQAGIESMQMVVGIDFSRSNQWTGEKTYGYPLHLLTVENPYLKSMRLLSQIIDRFDDDHIYPAYRFGCAESKDKIVVPLLHPFNENPHFQGFNQLVEGYKQAVQTTQLSGPTTFAPMIRQAIEVEKAYGGRQLIILVILTDGEVSNIELDKKAIEEASNYPISIITVGLGDGPFDSMEYFDDFKGKRKFDNFQFVNFTKIEKMSQRCENPELVLTTAMFMELPQQYKAMKQLGYL